jgi:hypothetical protein
MKVLTYTSALLLVILSTGCAPVQGFVNGQFAGDGADNLLHQMEIIAHDIAVVRDPSMTDEQWEAWLKSKTEGEFTEYIARIEFEHKRYQALLSLYSALVGLSSDADIDALKANNDAVKQSRMDAYDAQIVYYSED